MVCCVAEFKLVKCFSICNTQANPELAAVWAVGQRIWQRDFPGIYTAIAAYQWSENILPVMEALRGISDHNHVLFEPIKLICPLMLL